MDQNLLSKIASHNLWTTTLGREGHRADLQGADLQRANLKRADLQGADLQRADLQYALLQRADLQGANLQRANLQRANLQRANLQYARLPRASLQYASLQYASLQGASLQYASLQGASLQYASLQYASLQYASLQGANLQGANLQGANLQGANLQGANLSGALGIPTSAEWIRANTKVTKRGCILAYKAVGNTDYEPRPDWKIEPGAYLTEVVNPDRGTWCACGVNVGTLAFVRSTYPSATSVWLVGIEPADIADVVVPFGTEGKFRAGRVRLIRELAPEEK
jgi:hypothetical protein